MACGDLVVEVVIDLCGFSFANDSRQILDGGSLNLAYGAEMTHQIAYTLLAHAVDVVQRTCDEILASLLAVERDTEAVCLIADMAYDLQWLACATEVVGHRVVGVEDLLHTLCQADDRDILSKSQPLQNLIGVG